MVISLVIAGLVIWTDVVFAEACPRPSDMTAPSVFHFEHQVNGATWQEIRVWFVLADGFGDFESPLYLYRGIDRVWRTNAQPGQMPTSCQEQYRQFVDFSLGVLNEGKRPFTYDNQTNIADYEAFLLSKIEWRFFLPIIQQ